MNAWKRQAPLLRSLAQRRFLLPLLTLVVGVVASVVLSLFIGDNIEKEANLRFERQASDAKHAMEARVISYFNVLYGLAALFSKSDQTSRAEFHAYVQALDVEHRYPGIWGLNYATYLRHEDKARFESEVRSDTSLDPLGYPEFSVWPPGDRPDYVVLTYVQLSQLASVRTYLGLDLAANPRAADVRGVREALANHRDSGKVLTSGTRIDIGQGDSAAFGMRLAVYRRGMARDTVAERRAAYVGSVGAGFVVPELMAGVLQTSTSNHLRFKLYEAGP